MKFSTRLILWGLLLTSLPMLLIGYLSYNLAQETLKQEATERLETVQILMLKNFERWTNGNLKVLRSLAVRPLVIHLTQKHLFALKNAETGHVEHMSELTRVHLNSAVGERGGFEHISLLHPVSGQVLASTNSQLLGRFRERKDYFTQGQIRSVVNKLEYNPTSGQIHLHIATPMIGPDGALLGVLAGSVDWSEMVEILAQGQAVDSSMQTYLLNSFAYPVVLPNQTKGQKLPLHAFHSSGIDRCLAGFPGNGEYLDYSGNEVVGVYQWLPGYGFCMITEQPSIQVYHSLDTLKQQWVFIFIPTLMFAILISLLVTRRITLPLEKLLKGVNNVRHGDLNYRISRPSRDEIGRVAKSFNSMLDQVQLLTTSRKELTDEIEERKLIEQRLRDAEILYRTLFDQSPDGILLINPETFKILKFNAAALDILGWSDEAFSLLSIQDIDTQFDLEALRGLNQKLIKERVLDFNSQLIRFDKSTIEASVSLTLVEIDGQQLIHAVFRDISEMLQRMSELEQSESRFRRAIAEAPFPVLIHTEEGQVLQLSNSWLELTGYGLSEMSSLQELSKLFSAEEYSRFLGTSQQLTESEERAWDGSFRIWTKNNQQMNWDFSSTSLGVLPDQRAVFMRMAVDMTEHNLSQKKLEQSNKDLQQFAYVASHDLQEPLRVITGFIELLAKRYHGQLDDKADQYIDFITDGATRMRSLISGLLGYSRVISRHTPRKLFDVNDVLADVLQDLSLRIEETGTKIEFEPQPQITADSDQIKQVFQNLISNSIKFNRTPEPLVRISSYSDSGFWYFSVDDNGIGIETQYRERIFDIFQRLHSREEYEGTGIGLAVTKRVIERHGGVMTVAESDLGGSCFTFSIPVNYIDQTKQQEEA